jgi:hypothetical protein
LDGLWGGMREVIKGYKLRREEDMRESEKGLGGMVLLE